MTRVEAGELRSREEAVKSLGPGRRCHGETALADASLPVPSLGARWTRLDAICFAQPTVRPSHRRLGFVATDGERRRNIGIRERTRQARGTELMTRRNSASPRKDAATGKWCFVVDLGPGPDGTRRQARRRGFATKREAQEALDR
jgi:hypothetical protein